MKDAEYLFRQTERERKRTGHGDFCKVRQGGRKVRFPSDNLTKKQRMELNGKVMIYEMNKPITWADFKMWPVEHKFAYINRLVAKYNVCTRDLANMFGISNQTLVMARNKWGCAASHGKRKLDLAGWAAFLSGSEEPEETDQEVQQLNGTFLMTENKDGSAHFRRIPFDSEEGKSVTESRMRTEADAHNISVLLSALVGTGAKLTIEVTL